MILVGMAFALRVRGRPCCCLGATALRAGPGADPSSNTPRKGPRRSLAAFSKPSRYTPTHGENRGRFPDFPDAARFLSDWRPIPSG